jgi:predicted NUDIX family NTP pyrophosphohydrolase
VVVTVFARKRNARSGRSKNLSSRFQRENPDSSGSVARWPVFNEATWVTGVEGTWVTLVDPDNG